MQPNNIDLARLQQLSGPFVEELIAARTRLRMSTELASLTSDREELEYRMVLAFDEITLQEMPPQWSWEVAAVAISAHITQQMILELEQNAGQWKR